MSTQNHGLEKMPEDQIIAPEQGKPFFGQMQKQLL